MEVGGNEPVVMRDDVIGPRLRWDEVLRAMVPAKREDEGPSLGIKEQENRLSCHCWPELVLDQGGKLCKW